MESLLIAISKMSAELLVLMKEQPELEPRLLPHYRNIRAGLLKLLTEEDERDTND